MYALLINIKLYTIKSGLLWEYTDVKLSDKTVTVLKSNVVGFMPPLQLIYKHVFYFISEHTQHSNQTYASNTSNLQA